MNMFRARGSVRFFVSKQLRHDETVDLKRKDMRDETTNGIDKNRYKFSRDQNSLY